jgi:pimeloyl-ACP methyl ester carboxylesterase
MKKHYKVYNTFMCIVLLSASLLSTSFMAQAFSNNTPNTNPVLLIHGFLGKSQGASYWSKFNRLLKAEYPNEYHEDGDIFEHPWGAWEGVTDAEIDRLHLSITNHVTLGNSRSGKVDIVAHSFGGLLIRKYIQEKGAALIGRVVTIGTPHLGTALTRLVSYCNIDLPGNQPSCSSRGLSTGATQMNPNGPFLANLNRTRPIRNIQTKFMSIRSERDEIVPWAQSVLFGDIFFNTATCSNWNVSRTSPAPLYHMGQINEPLTVDYVREFLRWGGRSDHPYNSVKWEIHMLACSEGITQREATLRISGGL